MSEDIEPIDLVGDLAAETLQWESEAPRGERPDPFDDLLAFTLVTVVDGTQITPMGYEVTGE